MLRKRVVVFLFALVAFMITLPTTTSAQTIEEFRVIQGTTLWDLSELVTGDPTAWEQMFRANVEAGLLNQSNLTYNEAGQPIVWLAIGQRLLLTSDAEELAPEVVTTTSEPTLAPIYANPPAQAMEPEESGFPWWGWVLVAIATLMTIWIIGRLVSQRLDDPVNSGPPMRQGGINDSTAPDYFREMASGRTGTPGSTAYVPPERIRVINVRRGRGYGLMRVRYQGGREEVKHLNGEVVYQATVEFPDGHQETMFCLQGCANDIVYVGNRYFADRLFRFEPESASVYVPPQETVARAGNADIRITDEELTISAGGRTIAFGAENWTLQKGPDGGFIVIEEGHAGVVFRNGRIYGIELPKPAEAQSVPEPRKRKAPTTT